MSDSINCPNCGTSLRKGSTFCLKCGTRIVGGMAVAPIDTSPLDELPDSSIEDFESLDESALPDVDEWDGSMEEGDLLVNDMLVELEDSALESPDQENPSSSDEDITLEDEGSLMGDSKAETKREEESTDVMSWEVPESSSSEIREGMPFKEIEPPKVVDVEGPVINDIAMEEVIPETIEAVAHLFPKGRGDTSEDFIDAIVGKPKRIGADISPSIVEAPTCPECGAAMSTDAFEYPSYVYETMGRARMEHGIALLRENEHEKAIEQFEIAKKLYQHAKNEKLVQEAIRKVDQGYDLMAEHHYIQAEDHIKQREYEWGIVQYKKARELYMFSTDSKKRAKCSQRIRDAYEEWGKALESEGDRLAKAGNTRAALSKYTAAAEKYREADAPKRLRGLEKKIRSA